MIFDNNNYLKMRFFLIIFIIYFTYKIKNFFCSKIILIIFLIITNQIKLLIFFRFYIKIFI